MRGVDNKMISKMSDTAKGAVFIICSAFCFALMNMFVRLAGDLPSIEKSFFRNLVAAVVAGALLIKSGGDFRWGKGNLGMLFMRAGFGTLGILCNFYAIDHLVLADASMLNKLSPFFAVIFSFFILKERLKFFQGAMVVLAFIGALFIIKPTSAAFNFAGVIGFTGGMCAGLAYTMVRALSEHGERKQYIVFFFSVFSCLVTAPYLIFNFTPMTGHQLLMLLLAGLSATGGQFTITAAYSYAPARDVSVYDYTQIVFAAGLGFFVFDQIPDALSIIGYIIIVGVAVAMFVKNRVRA